jgi:predicted patatin/cPLA2 family phospholipase
MVSKVILVASLIGIGLGQICRSLSLEGGGSLGAYEAGAVWALVNLSNAEDVKWSVISGVSVGALNAASIAQFPVGEEVAMSEYLLNVWLGLNGSDSIFTQWPGGYIQGLLFEGGILNTAPLANTANIDLIYPIQRNVSIGSTNFDLGVFSTFNESLGKDIDQAILSSAAPPFFFPPHQFQGYSWADGGCIINLDVISAIERCLQVTSQENTVVDMIYDNYYAPLAPETNFLTLDVISRVFSIASYDSSIWYTYQAIRAYPNVKYRYIIHPSKDLGGGIVPLNFNKTVLENEIQIGINDTIKTLESDIDGKAFISGLAESLKRHIVYP